MSNIAFNAPLTVFGGFPSKFSVISNPDQAVDFLLDNWARYDSDLWYHAIAQCERAAHGKVSLENARGAFLGAAKEAGILHNADANLRV